MATWRKNESLGKALGREGGGIAKRVASELLSIGTLGLYKPRRQGSTITIRHPDGKIVRIHR